MITFVSSTFFSMELYNTQTSNQQEKNGSAMFEIKYVLISVPFPTEMQ